MNLDAMFAFALWAFFALVGAVYWLQRLRWRRRVRRGDPRRCFHPSRALLGNALHQLQAIAEPPAEYAIVEMLDEEDEEIDSGDPEGYEGPTVHLLRQAVKIRRGDRVDRLTALLGRR